MKRISTHVKKSLELVGKETCSTWNFCGYPLHMALQYYNITYNLLGHLRVNSYNSLYSKLNNIVNKTSW
jgi:hypothetical protein